MQFFFHLECLFILPLCRIETYKIEKEIKKKNLRNKEIIYQNIKKSQTSSAIWAL